MSNGQRRSLRQTKFQRPSRVPETLTERRYRLEQDDQPYERPLSRATPRDPEPVVDRVTYHSPQDIYKSLCFVKPLLFLETSSPIYGEVLALSRAYLRPLFASGVDYRNAGTLIPVSARKSADFRKCFNVLLRYLHLDTFALDGNTREAGFIRWADCDPNSSLSFPILDTDARDVLLLRICQEECHAVQDKQSVFNAIYCLILKSWANPEEEFPRRRVNSLAEALAKYRMQAATPDDYVNRLHKECLFRSAFIFPEPELSWGLA